jgi:TRAP-type mannitol/chloroaromatic compound transport system permease large subunit
MIAELIDPAILGFVLIGVMLFSIFVGFPISFTLIFLGFVFGYLGFGKLVFYLMTLQFSMVMTEQTLAAVPLFVFMGIMMEQAGLMERLFSAFQLMLAKVRGSLYYAVLFVSVIFAAATGIVGASVTIFGNTSNRFICSSYPSRNITSYFICSLYNNKMHDGS